jgi:curved DNA-binding protein CbpA
MAAPQASATGTLGSTPLPNLLVYSLDRRLTGTLVLEDEQGRKSAIRFDAGAPVKVKLGESVARLPEVVVAKRLTDAETAASVDAEAQTQKKLYGQVLVERGVIDAETLGEALDEQVLKRVEWLCTLGASTVYGYYDGVDLLSQYGGSGGATVDPLAVIWRALRLLARPETVDATLAKLGARELRLHPQSRAAKFRFEAKEQAVVDVLRAKPQSLAKIIASELLPAPQTKRVVYALVVTRHLDLGAGALPIGVSEHSLMPPGRSLSPGARSSHPAGRSMSNSAIPAATRSSSGVPAARPPSDPTRATPSAPSAAPRPKTSSDNPSSPKNPTPSAPRDEEFVAEIRAVAGTISEKNHYEVLGVERDVAASVIQAAFFRLAKRWHPDRLGAEFSDVKDLAVRVFARMTEAHQTLSNDSARREYDRLQKGSGADAEQEEVQRVLRAVTAFQKAEVFAKRGNLAEAEKQAAVAVENDPEQAEYVALYADVLSQNPERQKSNNYADVVKMVNEARKRQQDNMKVRLYRARVLNRSGDVDGAYREYRNIVEQDANNVEAAREVRLFEMRRGRKTTDPRKSLAPANPKQSQPRSNDKGKAENKGALNQDIGQIFGKLFKR